MSKSLVFANAVFSGSILVDRKSTIIGSVYECRPTQGPLLLDGLLKAKMTSMLKIKKFSKSSFGVNVKVCTY